MKYLMWTPPKVNGLGIFVESSPHMSKEVQVQTILTPGFGSFATPYYMPKTLHVVGEHEMSVSSWWNRCASQGLLPPAPPVEGMVWVSWARTDYPVDTHCLPDSQRLISQCKVFKQAVGETGRPLTRLCSALGWCQPSGRQDPRVTRIELGSLKAKCWLGVCALPAAGGVGSSLCLCYCECNQPSCLFLPRWKLTGLWEKI